MTQLERWELYEFIRDCLDADTALHNAKRWCDERHRLTWAMELAEARELLAAAQCRVAEVLERVVHER